MALTMLQRLNLFNNSFVIQNSFNKIEAQEVYLEIRNSENNIPIVLVKSIEINEEK